MCYNLMKHLPKNKNKTKAQKKSSLPCSVFVLCCQTDDVPDLLAFCLFACSAMSHFQPS